MNIFKVLAAAAVAVTSLVAFPSVSSAGTTSKDLYKQFQNPDCRYRPFVRWWWNGDRVEAEELVRELHILKEAGVGGVEINPISFPYGADPMDTKPLKWLSDEWIDMLKVVFDEAERLGMTCDLIVGSGWPFGAETLPRGERASACVVTAAAFAATTISASACTTLYVGGDLNEEGTPFVARTQKPESTVSVPNLRYFTVHEKPL